MSLSSVQREIAQTRQQLALLLTQQTQATSQDTQWRRDLWGWLSAQVSTIDEASGQLRPWPGDKGYLRELAALLCTERLLAIPKSRRMLISWLIAAYCTWKARYWPYQLMLVQSATEEKAAYLVGERCRFIEEHLPQATKRGYDSWRTKKGLVGKLRYQGTGSEILSVAQGADIVRSYTFSFLAMDEVEFQIEGHAALVAALPAVEKGAQLVLISTSDGPHGPLARLCKDVGVTRWT